MLLPVVGERLQLVRADGTLDVNSMPCTTYLRKAFIAAISLYVTMRAFTFPFEINIKMATAEHGRRHET